ncbi:hypothetical protein FACS189426_05880 [Bacteroidia bacterium]|nr:hypothetical protein FACS189426_05880 [Bacteroidia bacterium]GHV71786.1 hypothetical protein FACS189420_7960 [Bacteroidia bacterium]
MEFDKKGIAVGNTAEDYKSRKKFISDFYAQWIASNTTKHIYNKSLGCFIEVKYLSINETSGKAAYNYKSTLAVSYLTEILENAKVKKDKLGGIFFEMPKQNVRNQERFSKIFTMFYEKPTFGKIKLTVGELRGSGQKVQYCITAIEND